MGGFCFLIGRCFFLIGVVLFKAFFLEWLFLFNSFFFLSVAFFFEKKNRGCFVSIAVFFISGCCFLQVVVFIAVKKKVVVFQ